MITKMDRRDFIKTSGVCGTALLGGKITSFAQEERKNCRLKEGSALRVRPYQLLCLICAMGETNAVPQNPKMKAIYDAVHENPDMPVAIQCNAGDVYVYQNPGTDEDTPEGIDFNRKRDLDILQKMNWEPGIILPARTALLSLMAMIPTVAGICGYDAVTSDVWKGCPKAKSGNYEKGHKKGITAIIPPRSEAEMVKEKEASIKAMTSAKEVTTRPHILLCAVCQYGGGHRPPFKADNLPELLQMILNEKPDVLIKMARQADWMMCAPCPNRAPKLNACVNTRGNGGLSNEKRDLDMLQKLGLHFGSTIKARELYRLIFEKIPTTQDICKRVGSSPPSVWADGCGTSNVEKGNANYEKGRKELMEKLKLS
ncbi:MAG: hypothetical protein PHR77_10660 [Kiritimatiellae bacterium]|nr:hypothetical protein [Kiritimatiellia bacterium]MDD5521380.1 hypothetical protein [Kiritimatiellia bacterium]